MNTPDPVEFRRCYTCGKWHPVSGGYLDRFCSRECAKSFARCPVCGEYFDVNTLSRDGFCSAECAGIDTRDRAETMAEMVPESAEGE